MALGEIGQKNIESRRGAHGEGASPARPTRAPGLNRSGRVRAVLEWLLAALLALTAAVLLADTIVWMWRTWSPLPFWDQWDSLAEYIKFKREGPQFSELVRRHNEHRLVFPRLFFLADNEWFGAGNRLLVPMLLVIQLVHAAVLIVAGRPRLFHGPSYLAVSAVVVALLVSMAQTENLIWGFQIQFVGTFACATGAYVLLVEAVQRERNGRSWLAPLVGCLGLLVVAVFSMANGIVAASLAIVLALALRAARPIVLPLMATVVLCGVLYFIGYKPTSGGGVSALLRDPLTATHYVILYLGNIVAPIWQNDRLASEAVVGPLLLGLFGVALTGLAVVRVAIGRDRDPVRTAFVAVMLFVAASAVLTAAGRMSFGVEQAFSTRYATPVAIFWAVQLLYWNSVLASRASPAVRTAGFLVAGACVALLAFVQVRVQPKPVDQMTRVRWASDALLSNVEDSGVFAAVFPQPADVWGHARFLKAHRLSIFATPEARWLGRPLAQVALLEPKSACAGAFDLLTQPPQADGDAVRVEGWAWDLAGKREARRILIVDERGLIGGFASAGMARIDVPQARPEVRSALTGWRGFARVGNGETLTAYVLSKRGACRIGSLQAAGIVPQTRLADAPMGWLGKRVVAPAVLSGRFMRGGYHRAGGVPPKLAYGSWSGSDGNQGVLELGPFTTSTGRLAFGMVTGPDSSNQSIEVRDAATGELLSRVLPKVQTTWNWVAMDVPRERPIRLVVRDDGAGWGQWIGVTPLRELKAKP